MHSVHANVILVRILTKVEYGTFTYAWNIYSIVLLFNGMGMDSGVLQLASEHSGDAEYANRIYIYGTKFSLKFNLILVMVLLGIGLFAPLKIEAGSKLICALSVLPVFQLLYGLTLSYLRAQKRNQEYAKIQVVHTALVFIVSVGFVIPFRETGMVIGHYVAYIVAYLIGLLIFHTPLISKNAGELGEDKKLLLKISFISMLNNGLSELMFLLDVFVLGIVDPQETILANYKVAMMIPTAMTFIPFSMITYLYPYFAEHKDDGKWCINRYKQVLLSLGGFNIALSVVLFAMAPLIISILFGEQYLDVVPVFRLLAISYFFSGTFQIVSGNLLVTQRKLKFNLLVAVITSLTKAIADYFFVQWWGTMGAALATVFIVLLASILNTTYLVYTFRQKANAEKWRSSDEKI